jgi:hypothetical protein
MVHILDHLYYGITLITISLSLVKWEYIYCMPSLYTDYLRVKQLNRYIFITTL